MATRMMIVAVGIMLLLGGCVRPVHRNRNDVDEPVDLTARLNTLIPDFPVPQGFEIDEGRSRTVSAAGMRFIELVYIGKANKYAIKRFYERQMATCRWVLVTDRFIQGRIEMDFNKSSECCHIVIHEGGTLSSTELFVQIWSSGKITDRTIKKR